MDILQITQFFSKGMSRESIKYMHTYIVHILTMAFDAYRKGNQKKPRLVRLEPL
jgi:hypothetical protein